MPASIAAAGKWLGDTISNCHALGGFEEAFLPRRHGRRGTGQVAAVPERSSEANGRRPRGHREIAHDCVPLEPLALGSSLPDHGCCLLEPPPALPKGCVGVIFTK